MDFLKIVNFFFRFIYLNAIKGLTALGDIFPDKIIPIILEYYHTTALSIEARLKLGEALLMIAKRTGELLPKYGIVFKTKKKN